MGFIEKLRWWHWILISLLAGAILGFINASNINPPLSFRSMDQMRFEHELLRPPMTVQGKIIPWISNIAVFPPVASAENGNTTLKQLVTFDWLNSETTILTMDPCAVIVPCPYEAEPAGNVRVAVKYPGVTIYRGKEDDTLESIVVQQYGKYSDEGKSAVISANPVFRNATSTANYMIKPGAWYYIPQNPESEYSVIDFLKEISAQGSAVPFRYYWWRSQTYSYAIWMIGSFVVVGLIWPALIRILIYSGFGRSNIKDDYDLNKFGNHKPSPTTSGTANTTATENDLKRLKELEEDWTALVISQAGRGASDDSVKASLPKIQKLPDLPDRAVTLPTERDEKTYAGEFYPVEHAEEPKDGRD